MMPLQLVSWMILMRLDSKPLVRPRLRLSFEWSKDFAKEIMVKYDVPTAAYGTFQISRKPRPPHRRKKGAPIVVKADGLALGKGVVVAETVEQAIEAAHEMLWTINSVIQVRVWLSRNSFDGEEFSLFAFVNGDKFFIMPTAQDHKLPTMVTRVLTLVGWVPMRQVPHLPQSVVDTAVDTIVKPVLKGMIKEGRPYLGVPLRGANLDS